MVACTVLNSGISILLLQESSQSPMENHQFSSSPQTNISSGDDNNLQSLPPPPSSPLLPPTTSSQCSEKPKKGPNVTPRTFKRFFTPKSSLSRDNKAGASRQVLRDITASASNRPQQRASAKDAVRSSEEIKGAFPEVSKKKRKRHLPISPDTTPDRSSPLKRLKLPSLDISADSEGGRIVSEDELNDSEKEYCKGKPRAINPVQSNLRGRLGWSLSREIGGFSRPRLAQRLYHGGGKLASLALDEGANQSRQTGSAKPQTFTPHIKTPTSAMTWAIRKKAQFLSAQPAVIVSLPQWLQKIQLTGLQQTL